MIAFVLNALVTATMEQGMAIQADYALVALTFVSTIGFALIVAAAFVPSPRHTIEAPPAILGVSRRCKLRVEAQIGW